jgi:hypothetical protein
MAAMMMGFDICVAENRSKNEVEWQNNQGASIAYLVKRLAL